MDFSIKQLDYNNPTIYNNPSTEKNFSDTESPFIPELTKLFLYYSFDNQASLNTCLNTYTKLALVNKHFRACLESSKIPTVLFAKAVIENCMGKNKYHLNLVEVILNKETDSLISKYDNDEELENLSTEELNQKTEKTVACFMNIVNTKLPAMSIQSLQDRVADLIPSLFQQGLFIDDLQDKTSGSIAENMISEICLGGQNIFALVEHIERQIPNLDFAQISEINALVTSLKPHSKIYIESRDRMFEGNFDDNDGIDEDSSMVSEVRQISDKVLSIWQEVAKKIDQTDMSDPANRNLEKISEKCHIS